MFAWPNIKISTHIYNLIVWILHSYDCDLCSKGLDEEVKHQLDCGHICHKTCFEETIKNGIRNCSKCAKPLRPECFVCEAVLEKSPLEFRQLRCGHKCHLICMGDSVKRGLAKCYVCDRPMDNWDTCASFARGWTCIRFYLAKFWTYQRNKYALVLVCIKELHIPTFIATQSIFHINFQCK